MVSCEEAGGDEVGEDLFSVTGGGVVALLVGGCEIFFSLD